MKSVGTWSPNETQDLAQSRLEFYVYVGGSSFDLGRSSGQLLLHFCNENPPTSQSRINCWIISLASDGESAPPKMSTTYLPFVIGMTALR